MRTTSSSQPTIALHPPSVVVSPPILRTFIMHSQRTWAEREVLIKQPRSTALASHL